jgi:DNA primase large subunit
LKDALEFWKKAFSAKKTPDEFEKNYAYSIKHNYGEEGKREQYTPFSCRKCIDMVPSNGE